jgi:hypothetical protein
MPAGAHRVVRAERQAAFSDRPGGAAPEAIARLDELLAVEIASPHLHFFGPTRATTSQPPDEHA